jgi:opacity protein-like surface antigen
VRALAAASAAALLIVPAAFAQAAQPPVSWLAQAMCVHRHEGPWAANTGNGYFGGMQFAAATWRRMKGSPQLALRHPGNPAYPFAATEAEQLQVAWRVWLSDGRSWKAWGDVGALCARLP